MASYNGKFLKNGLNSASLCRCTASLRNQRVQLEAQAMTQTLKLNMRSPIGTFLIEGSTQMEVFKAIAVVQEVFSESRCGLCGCEDIRYVVREVKKKNFPEIHCQNPECRARLTFGQNQEPKVGWIYPKRRLLKNGKPDPKGEFGKHRGWSKYRGAEEDDE